MTLDGWRMFLGISDCCCGWAWRSLGRLYGVDCGEGWVRVTTDPSCRAHGRGKARR